MLTLFELLNKTNSNFKFINALPYSQFKFTLENIFHTNFVNLLTFQNRILTTEELDLMNNTNKNLGNNTPIEYIFNTAKFCGLDFKVDKNVLIPREKTEELINSFFEWFEKYHKVIIKDKFKLQIYDLCTGSGCIAITIAYKFINKYNFSNFEILGIDISSKALKVARFNRNNLLKENKNKIKFKNEDISSSTGDRVIINSINIIISNPPYIPSKKIHTLQKSVKNFEPKIALDGGNTGLDFYKYINNFDKIINADIVLLECNGIKQKKSIRKMWENKKKLVIV